MAPGPGGPHGGGGPHRGGFGPHRGGFGPHRGGFGPHRGGFGPHRGGFRPHGGPPKPTAIGNNSSGGELWTDRIFDAITGASKARADRKEKFGKRATIMGLKLSTTGAFREDLFKSRIQTADELLAEKRITLAESKKRKMEAATKYYDYLRKIGYVTQEEYDEDMLEFAQSIGASYTPSGNRRTK